MYWLIQLEMEPGITTIIATSTLVASRGGVGRAATEKYGGDGAGPFCGRLLSLPVGRVFFFILGEIPVAESRKRRVFSYDV